MILLSTLLLTGCNKNEAPVISGLDNLTYIIGEDAPNYLAGVTARDPEDGDLTDKIYVDVQAVDLNTVGTYEVTYLVFDSLGAKALETRTIDVIKVEENKVAEYIKNANYQSIVNEPVQVNVEFSFDEYVTMSDKLPYGLQIQDATIGLTGEFDLNSYEEATGHLRLDVFVENVNMVKSLTNKSTPIFTLYGYIDMVIANQTVYIDNYIYQYAQSPLQDKDGNPLEYVPIEERKQIAPFSNFINLLRILSKDYKDELEVIKSYFLPVKQQVAINFSESKFNLISLALPQVIATLTNSVNYSSIKESTFKFSLDEILNISKTGQVFDTSSIKDLNIIPELILDLISTINNFEVHLNNENYSFSNLDALSSGKVIVLYPIYEKDENADQVVKEFYEVQTNFSLNAAVTTKDVVVNSDVVSEDYEVAESNPVVDLFF